MSTSAGRLLGHITSLGYDGAGNLIKRIDPLGGETQSVYNIWDKPLSISDALGVSQGFAYDDQESLI
jgi:YD repeat-containing protein